MRAALVGLALSIVVADLAQVAFLGKGMGAIAGAMVYGMIAVMVAGAGRGRIRLGAGVAVFMPFVPLAVFTGLLGGEARESLVDLGMILVFVLQVGAGSAGLALLVQTSGAPRDRGSDGPNGAG
jgi:hypothetical protein